MGGYRIDQSSLSRGTHICVLGEHNMKTINLEQCAPKFGSGTPVPESPGTLGKRT